MKENTEKVKGGSDIPSAPVPSQVRMSRVTEQIPVEKKGSTVTPVGTQSPGDVEEHSIKVGPNVEEVDAHPKGTIMIKVFENSPYEVDFDGVVTGIEVGVAIMAMKKQYRVWKHNVFLKETKEGG